MTNSGAVEVLIQFTSRQYQFHSFLQACVFEMKANVLLTILILLCLTLNALASVLPTPRHIQLNKRDININFNDFENFEFPKLSK